MQPCVAHGRFWVNDLEPGVVRVARSMAYLSPAGTALRYEVVESSAPSPGARPRSPGSRGDSEGGIRTHDLRDMSPVSNLTAPPRGEREPPRSCPLRASDSSGIDRACPAFLSSGALPPTRGWHLS